MRAKVMKCRWCGWIVPGDPKNPERALAEHVATCALSVACDYCGSGQRVPCFTASGKHTSFHRTRRRYW